MYRPVPKVPDFPSIEQSILKLWDEIQPFRKLRARIAGGPRWSFLDGPITANNPMGVHHAWGRALKDMLQRYHAMNGKDQRFQNGFDCQGLWVEVEVEKSIPLASKKEIYQYGIDRFVGECKQRVLTYAARIVEQSIRLGHWCDWDDPKTLLALRDALAEGDREITIRAPSGAAFTDRASRLISRLGSAEFGGSYFTFSDENNYTIWAFLKKCHQEGFLYRGHDVMPWCGRCGTGLSQMEVAEGRRIVRHLSVFVRFPLRNQPDTALLVWTTTPWTLSSNVAVAVHPDMTYLRVRHGDWIYYVGQGNFERERVQDLQVEGHHEVHKLPSIRTLLRGSGNVEVLGEVPGRELIGLTYQGPFDSLPAQQTPGGVFPFGSTGQGKTAADSHRVIPWSEVSELEGTGLVHIAPGCGAEDQMLGFEHDLPFLAPLDEGAVFMDGFGELTGRPATAVAEDVVQHLRGQALLVAREKYPHVYPHCWRCKEELVFRPVDEWFIRMSWRDRIQRIVPEIRWIPPDGEAREQDWLLNMGDWMISKKRFWGLALPIWVCEQCQHFMVIGGREELRRKAVSGWDLFDGHSPHRPHIDAVKIACERCGGQANRIEDVGNPWLDAGIVSFSTLRYNSDRAYWSRWFPADLVLECFPGQFRNWFYSLLSMSAMMDGRAPFRTLLGHALVRDARGDEMHKSKGNAIAFDEAAEVFGAEVMRYIFAEQKPTQNLNFPDLHPSHGAGATLDKMVRRKLLTLWNCYSFFITYATADGWRGSESSAGARLQEMDRWILSRLQRLVAAARAAFEDFAIYRLMEGLQQFDEEFSNWYLRRSRRRFWKSEADDDKAAAYRTLYSVLTTVVRTLAPVLPFFTEEIYQNLVRSTDPQAPESVHLTDYPTVDETLIDEALERDIETVIRIKNLVLNLRMQSEVKIRQPLPAVFVKPRDQHERTVLSRPDYVAQILEEGNIKELRLIEDDSCPLPIKLQDEGTLVALDTTVTPELRKEGIARDFNRFVQDQRRAMNLAVSDRIEVRYSAPPHIVEALTAHQEFLRAELLANRIEAAAADPAALRFRLAGEEVSVSIRRA